MPQGFCSSARPGAPQDGDVQAEQSLSALVQPGKIPGAGLVQAARFPPGFEKKLVKSLVQPWGSHVGFPAQASTGCTACFTGAVLDLWAVTLVVPPLLRSVFIPVSLLIVSLGLVTGLPCLQNGDFFLPLPSSWIPCGRATEQRDSSALAEKLRLSQPCTVPRVPSQNLSLLPKPFPACHWVLLSCSEQPCTPKSLPTPRYPLAE